MALGTAVRRAIKQSRYETQEPFADALGVDQTTVSKWVRGITAMTVEQVLRVEEMCDLPRGQVFVWAELVDPGVEWPIAADEVARPRDGVVRIRLVDAAEDQSVRSDRQGGRRQRVVGRTRRPTGAPEDDRP